MLRENHHYCLSQAGANIVPLSANRCDDARTDIRATGFRGRQKCLFFDVRVFHPNTQSYHHSTGIMSRQGRENMATESAKLKMELPSLHLCGGIGREATLFYKHLADSLSEKRNIMYSKTIAWMRCTLSSLYDLQLCAFEAAAQNLTEYPMPALNLVLQRVGSLAKLYKYITMNLFLH